MKGERDLRPDRREREGIPVEEVQRRFPRFSAEDERVYADWIEQQSNLQLCLVRRCRRLIDARFRHNHVEAMHTRAARAHPDHGKVRQKLLDERVWSRWPEIASCFESSRPKH